MKFKDGYMLKSGHAVEHFVDKAIRHICLKQGVLGIRVAIMLPYDPQGKTGTNHMQPDVVTVHEPKVGFACTSSVFIFSNIIRRLLVSSVRI
jgi:small subunit ribosomal protein S3e